MHKNYSDLLSIELVHGEDEGAACFNVKQSEFASGLAKKENSLRRFGITLKHVNVDDAEHLNKRFAGECLKKAANCGYFVVKRIDGCSWADCSELMVGDILLKLDTCEVQTWVENARTKTEGRTLELPVQEEAEVTQHFERDEVMKQAFKQAAEGVVAGFTFEVARWEGALEKMAADGEEAMGAEDEGQYSDEEDGREDGNTGESA